MAQDITLELENEAATLAAGARLADFIVAGLTIYLRGDLGVGKTTFIRGMLHHLGYIGKVKSPTYTLIEPYVISELQLYHFDLYRFIGPEEWDATGFRDYFNPQSVCMVEWPERAGSLLPKADIDIHLSPYNQGRQLMLSSNTDAGKQCLEQFLET